MYKRLPEYVGVVCTAINSYSCRYSFFNNAKRFIALSLRLFPRNVFPNVTAAKLYLEGNIVNRNEVIRN